ncbi:heterokaryon incompatibility protein-domain-containing protein [Xylogone sp. PMI_703]|nr:heterokaryon incompatibility protein-domain-containing protein [Xylogone sp. PMI_703]
MSSQHALPSRKRKREFGHDQTRSKFIRYRQGTSTATKKSIEVLRRLVRQSPPTRDFVYSPLLDGNGQDIRVLVILPGEYHDPIECKLVPSSLPHSPESETEMYKYTALSYYWGNDGPGLPITLMNYQTVTEPLLSLNMTRQVLHNFQKSRPWKPKGTFYVRANLYAALRHFRDEKQEVTMWIDALCIDQEDDNERTRQIKQMHEVYSQAEEVCVWLGDGSEEGSPDPKACFKFLKRILDLKKLDILLNDLREYETSGFQNPPRAVKKCINIVNLMWNKWFSRRWVIQELALARKASVHYGNKKIPWVDFSDAISLFIQNYDRIGHVLQKFTSQEADSPRKLRALEAVKYLGANTLVDVTSNLFRRTESGEIHQWLWSLEELVSYLLPFEASEPKDIIYSVLSLAKDTRLVKNPDDQTTTLDNRLIPDYKHKSLRDVYVDFVGYCIDTSGSLDILCRHWAAASRPNNVKALNEILELPTWIPSIEKSSFGTVEQRLQGRVNGDSFVGNPIRNSRPIYNASAGLIPKYRLKRSKPDKKKTRASLSVKGICIGSIERAAVRAVNGMIFHEVLEMAGFDYNSSQNGLGWSEDRERVPEELWRTLVADRGHEGRPAPHWYALACMDCLNHLNANGDLDVPELLNLPNAAGTVKAFLKRVREVIFNRVFILVKSEPEQPARRTPMYGLAPSGAREGDIICILFGCSVPVVLRSQGHHFEVIGECYVHGMMDGEALADKEWKHPYKEAKAFNLR